MSHEKTQGLCSRFIAQLLPQKLRQTFSSIHGWIIDESVNPSVSNLRLAAGLLDKSWISDLGVFPPKNVPTCFAGQVGLRVDRQILLRIFVQRPILFERGPMPRKHRQKPAVHSHQSKQHSGSFTIFHKAIKSYPRHTLVLGRCRISLHPEKLCIIMYNHNMTKMTQSCIQSWWFWGSDSLDPSTQPMPLPNHRMFAWIVVWSPPENLGMKSSNKIDVLNNLSFKSKDLKTSRSTFSTHFFPNRWFHSSHYYGKKADFRGSQALRVQPTLFVITNVHPNKITLPHSCSYHFIFPPRSLFILRSQLVT